MIKMMGGRFTETKAELISRALVNLKRNADELGLTVGEVKDDGSVDVVYSDGKVFRTMTESELIRGVAL